MTTPTEPLPCLYCGDAVGNTVFTVCDDCWEAHPLGKRMDAPDESPAVQRGACSRCGKAHWDEGEWATREHRTHRCVDDRAGKGCGHEWRADESPAAEPPLQPREYQRAIDGLLAAGFLVVKRKTLSSQVEKSGEGLRTYNIRTQLAHAEAENTRLRAALTEARCALRHALDYCAYEYEADQKLGALLNIRHVDAIDAALTPKDPDHGR